MTLSVVQRLVVIPNGRVGVAQTPTGARLSNFVAQLLCDGEVSLVVINGDWELSQEGVGVAQTVARLSLDRAFTQLNGKGQGASTGE